MKTRSAARIILAFAALLCVAAGPSTSPSPDLVNESTSDDSFIAIATDTLVVTPLKNRPTQIMQVQRMQNSGTLTFSGTKSGTTKRTLRLPVAEGGFDIFPQSGIRLGGALESGAGIFATNEVAPGQHTVVYLYRIQIPPTGWSFQREIHYPTKKFAMLVDPSLRASGGGWHKVATQRFRNRSYIHYERPGLPAGATLKADIFSSGGSDTYSPVALALGAAAIATAIMLALRVALRRGRRNKDSFQPQAALPEREALIFEIAKLDEQFAEGDIAEGEYRELRRKLKDALSSHSSETPVRAQ